MDTHFLTRKFEDLGARLKIVPSTHSWGRLPQPVSLDIRRDSYGEYFDLSIDERQVERVDAVDVRPKDRHLLLMAWIHPFAGPVRYDGRERWRSTIAFLPPVSAKVEKPRFLCGHDERHWFVAAIPESAHAATVHTAMEALKPPVVIAAQSRTRMRFAHRFTRKNRVFVRQGEWFFLPHPELIVPANAVLHNEPMQRSGNKPHWAEFAYRQGGETVYVSKSFPNGLSEKEYRRYMAEPRRIREQFRIMRRNATLFVRGRISHPDHATVVLNLWHEVAMNTENHAKARANVVFLD